MCGDDEKCGPLKITLFKKRSKIPFQNITAGRIFESDSKNPLSLVDLNFDGNPDLTIFDGYTGPGGYITLSMRIYLYSESQQRFVYNEALSELSQQENMGSLEIDKKRKRFYAYSRPGSGEFWHRGYSVTGDKVQMVEETITDTTLNNGTLTLITTRKLINGRWREWCKHAKLPINY
jgi:hypothetical protein